MRLAGRAMPETTPSLARRMCHDAMRPGVPARVAVAVPRIDVRQSAVDAFRFNKEGRDHLLIRR
jgi:hypothetical protein